MNPFDYLEGGVALKSSEPPPHYLHYLQTLIYFQKVSHPEDRDTCENGRTAARHENGRTARTPRKEERLTSPPPDVFVVTFRASGGAAWAGMPGEARLRALLAVARRRFGLVAVSVDDAGQRVDERTHG